MALGRDLAHQLGVVPDDLTDHEDGAHDAPVGAEGEHPAGGVQEAQLGPVVGAVVLDVEGEGEGRGHGSESGGAQ